jgi:biopolymer transport protein ExbD
MRGATALAHWDVFHSERLEVERGLTTAAVRAGLASGAIRDDDLVRPAGTTTPWARLADLPGLPDDAPPAPAPEPPRTPEPDFEPDSESGSDFESPDLLAESEFEIIEDDAEYVAEIDDEEEDEEDSPKWSAAALAATLTDDEDVPPTQTPTAPDDGPYSALDLRLDKHDDVDPENSIEIVEWDDDLDEEDPQDQDEAAAEFTLSRGSAETVEELDLAAMVDVAFQLVLFFLVTATTVLYKSLEVPKPNPESRAPEAAQQGRSKSLEDLKDDFILVEIDTAGAVKIDREPVAADVDALAERLRAARERTGRKSMLLSADFATLHKSTVLAYDAANEIGLGIAIARPTPKPVP